ncbi:hypothetical protein C7212DRAFT_344606 [Tuber magnatum]|uniref:Uncharacterized protein n=1 Tax=Tuber magnatum TaxID=42249 RepID=A0A317SQS7_9PEZI|nr:hypothetical protein C7212DRAFT_344606 [Tuber magnatum]
MAAVSAHQVGVYTTPSDSQTPPPRGPLDIRYYLREGLRGAVHQRYGGAGSFTKAIESQADELRARNASRWCDLSRNCNQKRGGFSIQTCLSSSRNRLANPGLRVWTFRIPSTLRSGCALVVKNSRGEVRIVLLFSICETTRSIHLEKWEMPTVPNHPTQANPQASVTRPTKIHQVDIGGPVIPAPLPAPVVLTPVAPPVVVTGALLTIDFDKILLHQPGPGEGNFVFTAQDLRLCARNVWRVAQ